MNVLTTVVVGTMTVVVAAEVSGTTVVVVDAPPLLDDLEDLVVLTDFAANFVDLHLRPLGLSSLRTFWTYVIISQMRNQDEAYYQHQQR